MQNFRTLPLKLREEIENDVRTYSKNAIFQKAPYGIKILLLIFAKLLLLHSRGIRGCLFNIIKNFYFPACLGFQSSPSPRGDFTHI